MGKVKYMQDQAQNLQRFHMWGSGLLIYEARSRRCCVLVSKVLFIYTHPWQRDFSTEQHDESPLFTLIMLLVSVPKHISPPAHFLVICSYEAGY